MDDDLRSYVSDLPIFDVHEHHMPEILGNREIGLLALLWQSYAGWTQARPYPLASESRLEDPMFAGAGQGTWEEIARFVEESGANSFVRNMIAALKPTGRVVIIEHSPEKAGEKGFDWHTTLPDSVVFHARTAGYELVKRHSFLELDEIYVFRVIQQDKK